MSIIKIDKTSILNSAIIVTVVTLICKLLGFIKQAVYAAYFGATYQTDVFFAADSFVKMIAGIVFSGIIVSFLAYYTKSLLGEGREKANVLVSNTLVVYQPVSILTSILIFIAAPVISILLIPGLGEEAQDLMTDCLRVLSVVPIFYCVNYVFSAVLQGERRFIQSQLITGILSIFLIASAVFFSDSMGVYSLWGGTIVGVIFVTVFLFAFVKKDIKFKVDKPFSDKRIHTIIFASVPLAVSTSIIAISTVIDKMIASSLGEGVITYVTYSQNLQNFVIAFLVTNMCVILFANFANYVAVGEIDKVRTVVSQAITYLTLLLLPISIITALSSYEVVDIVYGRGEFTDENVIGTSIILIGYGIGFIPVMMQNIYFNTYYAMNDTLTPMKIGILSTIFNIILSIIGAYFLGAVGIALGTSAAAIIGSFLGYKWLGKHLPNLKIFREKNLVVKLIISGVLCLVAVELISLINIESNMISFLLATIVGFAVYVGSLIILKCELLIEVISLLKKKIKR